MASSDDFRKQLKAGNISEALALALSKAVELKITTWVASQADDVEADQAQPGHRLRTRINTIDGDIENEIGDVFLGHGPYRELRQFHLEQVAEGNKIIQNNLKSLQKLFEILVALRYPETVTPTPEPESLDVESPLLPPPELVPEAGLVSPPPFPVEESVVSPDAGVEDLNDAGVTIESPTVPVADSGINLDTLTEPDTLAQDDISQLPPELVEDPSSLPTLPTDSPEELDADDDDDDWDNSVLDLLELLPVEPPPPEDLDSGLDEDWGDLVEEKPDPDLDVLDSAANQDWGIITLDDLEESPPTSAEPNIQPSNAEVDEDWGDMVEPDVEVDRDNPVPSMESLNFEEDEDWGEWVVEDQELFPDEPVTGKSLADLDDDEDWGDSDFDEDSDPLTTASAFNQSASDSEEDWDEFVAEELEPFSDILHEDTSGKPSEAQNQNPTESESDCPDLRDNQETDASTQNNPLEENADTQPKSTEKRVPPPPPPPSRFPHRNP